MRIRSDDIQKVALDRFTSASGRWISLLCTRYEPHDGNLIGHYIVIVTADTFKVRKVVRIAVDDPLKALATWEAWKQSFAIKSDTVYEDEVPNSLREFTPSLPVITKEDEELMLKLRPTGSRLFVRDITPVDEVTARAAEAGLHIVIDEANKPRPSMGIVLKLGPDPFLVQEGYKVGQIVMFGKHAGDFFSENNQTYRCLEVHEIKGVRDPEDGMEDLLTPGVIEDMPTANIPGDSGLRDHPF